MILDSGDTTPPLRTRYFQKSTIQALVATWGAPFITSIYSSDKKKNPLSAAGYQNRKLVNMILSPAPSKELPVTGSRILIGKFCNEVCREGSRDMAIVSVIHPCPGGLAGPCHSVTVRSRGVPSLAASASGGQRLFGSTAGPRGTGHSGSRHRQAGKEAVSLWGARYC